MAGVGFRREIGHPVFLTTRIEDVRMLGMVAGRALRMPKGLKNSFSSRHTRQKSDANRLRIDEAQQFRARHTRDGRGPVG